MKIIIVILFQFFCLCFAQLSEEDKTKLLKMHNDMRSKLAKGEIKDASGAALPKAANMQKMVIIFIVKFFLKKKFWSKFQEYDEELAKTSQSYAEKCIFEHGLSIYLYDLGYLH